MWHALRAELTYFRAYLLGGLGIAVGVAAILTVVFLLVGDDGPPRSVAAVLRGMFMMMAPLIVGFITQALRSEEGRARLLLTGPLTPRQLGGVNVLIPTLLFALGMLISALSIGVEFLITGELALETLKSIIGFVGGQLFAYLQLGLLVQEATAASRQRRTRAAMAGWTGLGASVLLLAVLYLLLMQASLTWTHLVLGHLLVAATAMAASVSLYAGRTDFTR